MDFFKVCFYLECLEREKLKIYLTVSVDPAGSVSSSLANIFGKGNPYKTLMGIRRVAKEKKYIELGKKSPARPLIEAYFESIGKKKS